MFSSSISFKSSRSFIYYSYAKALLVPSICSSLLSSTTASSWSCADKSYLISFLATFQTSLNTFSTAYSLFSLTFSFEKAANSPTIFSFVSLVNLTVAKMPVVLSAFAGKFFTFSL